MYSCWKKCDKYDKLMECAIFFFYLPVSRTRFKCIFSRNLFWWATQQLKAFVDVSVVYEMILSELSRV